MNRGPHDPPAPPPPRDAPADRAVDDAPGADTVPITPFALAEPPAGAPSEFDGDATVPDHNPALRFAALEPDPAFFEDSVDTLPPELALRIQEQVRLEVTLTGEAEPLPPLRPRFEVFEDEGE